MKQAGRPSYDIGLVIGLHETLNLHPVPVAPPSCFSSPSNKVLMLGLLFLLSSPWPWPKMQKKV